MSSPNNRGAASTKAAMTAVSNLKGEQGCRFISGTGAQTPTSGLRWWTAIQCISACVFSTLTNNTNEGASMNSVTLAAGTVIYGQFTAITLASGSVIAYY